MPAKGQCALQRSCPCCSPLDPASELLQAALHPGLALQACCPCCPPHCCRWRRTANQLHAAYLSFFPSPFAL